MRQFIFGVLTTQTALAALFFWHYFRMSGERLFLFFALAFVAMSLNWIGLAWVEPAMELEHYVFLLRLLAFALIIVGIVDRNRRARG